MDKLNKIIKKLNAEEYHNLLESIGVDKKSKPYQVLSTARIKDLTDSEMMELLDVNSSTYYTLKSRLVHKVATALSQKPINELKEKVANVGASIFDSNKFVSIKVLKELEKQLIEYDLSNELIIMYKTLAILHLFDEEAEHYSKLYERHVAFSLAVSKAEDLLYQFIKGLGIYRLTRREEDLDRLDNIRRELFNIGELYKSHRLFVIQSIVRIYYMCTFSTVEELQTSRADVERIIEEVKQTFFKYDLDIFYQNYQILVHFMYFEYYQRSNSISKSYYHFEKANALLPQILQKHIMNFFTVQFLQTKLCKYLVDRDLKDLLEMNSELESNLEIQENEVYHYVNANLFLLTIKFYEGDYSIAAKGMNDIRNKLSLRAYPHADIECRLFQALQYCILGDETLCQQIIQSTKRLLQDLKEDYENAHLFLKVLKTAMKTSDLRTKVKKITKVWDEFSHANNGSRQILPYIHLDDKLLHRMANPLKTN